MTAYDRINRAFDRVAPQDVPAGLLMILWLLSMATLGWPVIAFECWWRGFR